MKSLLSALAVIAATMCAAQACDITAQTGEPQGGSPNATVQICRTGYQLRYDPTRKNALWSAEHMVGANLRGSVERGNEFSPDPLVEDSQEAQLDDFRASGFARGHLAPAGDFTGDANQMRESFYLTNMVPQVQRCNNSGVWSQIERMVRDWAVGYGQLYVVTGPVYWGEPQSIGKGVAVPQALFKAIWNPRLNQTLAFMVPNTAQCGRKPREFVVNVNQVEQLTGLQLFPLIQAMPAERIWQ